MIRALSLSLLCASVAFAAVWLSQRAPEAPARGPACGAENQEDALKGLWSRWPDKRSEGDPLRFYYFHGDGHGLYRYGRVGFTNTHSFDYRLHGEEVELKFRKTGASHRLGFSTEVGRDGRRVLHLKDDPEEHGGAVDYFYVPAPLGGGLAFENAKDAPLPSGRMWIHKTHFATGGEGFSLYQLTPAGIDGRGTGWHHRGDFDDWSTESLTYRVDGDHMELRFDLSGERHATGYGVAAGEGGRRLVLHEDPRNWWQRSTFHDMGRSFAAAAFGGPFASAKMPD
jgi:hypothetical protein